MKKMTFNGVASVLCEKEMQNVMAGSGVNWACVGLIFTASLPWTIGFGVVGGPIGIAGGLTASAVYTAVGAFACR